MVVKNERYTIRRKDDRSRRDILKRIEEDFAAIVRPLQDEIERQKEVRRLSAVALHDWRNNIIRTIPLSKRKNIDWAKFLKLLFELEGITGRGKTKSR